MRHYPGSDHVQINVNHAIPKVGAVLNHRAVVAVGPESSTPVLAPVVALGKLALDLLHPLADRPLRFRPGQQVRVIGRDAIAQHRHRKLLHASPEQLQGLIPVPSKLEEELTVVTTMGQMVELARNDRAIGPWHRFSICPNRFACKPDRGGEKWR